MIYDFPDLEATKETAIVARELRIPEVVGYGNATMRLKTSNRIRVDGEQGIITIF